MSKKNITNSAKLCSTWGGVLIAVLLTLVIVVGWNYLTEKVRVGGRMEGFEQMEKVSIKEGPEVYDDFYVNIAICINSVTSLNN